jgi:MarR family transcriptional regulator, organic hydroperoxide resistance regulator
MNPKARRSSEVTVETPTVNRTVTTDDFWPMVIEFTLSQKAWWIGCCEEFGLTAMQGHTLRLLDPDRPVAMSALADHLTCDASNVTGIVDKLETRGLVARQGAGHDRRIKMLAVTEEGRRLRERLNARMMEPPAVIASVTPADRRRLAAILRAIVDERAAATQPARKADTA